MTTLLPARPTDDHLRELALGTTLRPVEHAPQMGDVLVNVAGLCPGWDAAAIYHRPANWQRRYHEAWLVVGMLSDGKSKRQAHWYKGLVCRWPEQHWPCRVCGRDIALDGKTMAELQADPVCCHCRRQA